MNHKYKLLRSQTLEAQPPKAPSPKAFRYIPQRRQKTGRALSFRLEARSTLLDQLNQLQIPQTQTPQPSSHTNLRKSTLKVTHDHPPPKKLASQTQPQVYKLRRQSQHEQQISGKQRRLDHMAPESYIQQNLMHSNLRIRRKFNKVLKINFKFLMGSKQHVNRKPKHLGQCKSMVVSLSTRIRHRRSKSVGRKPDVETLVPIGKHLEDRIARMMAAKSKRRNLRKTTMLEVKNSVLLSKEKLLSFQKMLKEVMSSELTPQKGQNIDFKKLASQKPTFRIMKNRNFQNLLKSHTLTTLGSFHAAIHSSKLIRGSVPTVQQESLIEFMQKRSQQQQDTSSHRIKTQPSFPTKGMTGHKPECHRRLNPYLKAF